MQVLDVKVSNDGPKTVVEFLGEGDETIVVHMHNGQGHESANERDSVLRAKEYLVQVAAFGTAERG